MSHLEEPQLFSIRMGRADPSWRPLSVRRGLALPDSPLADFRYATRHHAAVPAEDVKHQCRCPGTLHAAIRIVRCALPVTQEDGLCDECRQWCVYMVEHRPGEYFLIADWVPA